MDAPPGWFPAATMPDDGSMVGVHLIVDADGDGWHTPLSDLEYSGGPVVARAWGKKLKTLVNPLRINPEDVWCWRPLPAGWDLPKQAGRIDYAAD